MKIAFIYIVVIFVANSYNNLFPQHNNLQKNLNSITKVNNTQEIILNNIEEGILNNDIKSISQYFTSQPYISLINGVNGYYSSNQAYYILEDFFDTYKVVQFKFEEKKTEEAVSYGKGFYLFEKKGTREKAHLYLTLSKYGSKWYITQISIN